MTRKTIRNRKQLASKHKLAVLPAVLVLIFGFTLTPATAGICPQGLVGYWKLDDTGSPFSDASANDNNGTCHTACPTPLAQGAVGTAQSFDGTSSGITLPAASAFDWNAGDSFSIELWVKKSGTIHADGEVLVGRRDPDTQLAWQIRLNSNGTVSFTLVSSGGDGAGQLVNGSKIINNNVWHHIAAIRDATADTNVLYVDGQLDGSISNVDYGTDFASTAAGPTIGFMDGPSPARFAGDLDEVALHSRALAEAEIGAHYFLSRDYCGLYDSKIRIMPMGDSITYDVHSNDTRPIEERISYRKALWESLAGGFYYVDFVGNKPAGSGFDLDNAGFSGITSEGLLSVLNSGINTEPIIEDVIETDGPYLNYYPTDVILLHIGTNDIFRYGLPTDISVGNVAAILDEIDRYSPNVTVILAEIVNFSESAPTDWTIATTNLNAAVSAMAQERIENGDKIMVVNMETGAGLDYQIDSDGAPPFDHDFWDQVHPNDLGYGKMAPLWLANLQLFLPRFQLPLIQEPATPLVATQGALFQYTVPCEGAPPPSFSLVGTPPDGMTISSSTGIISWIPETTGNFTVTVQAQNRVPEGTTSLSLATRTDTFEIPITVSAVPQTVADTYQTKEGETLTVNSATGVLANDTGGSLAASLVATTAHGSLALDANGSFVYTHDGSETLSDTFSYTADSGSVSSKATTATITIAPVNDQPQITGQKNLSTAPSKPLTLSLNDLTAKDDDNSYPTDFTLKIGDGQNYTYSDQTITPKSGFTGKLTVPVKINDGKLDSPEFNLNIRVGKTDSGDGGGGGCFIDSIRAHNNKPW
jgi:VCBS repeat-containing protein